MTTSRTLIKINSKVAFMQYPAVVQSGQKFRAYLAEGIGVGPWVEFRDEAQRILDQAAVFERPERLVGQVWEDRSATYLADSERWLVKVTGAYRVEAGASVTVHAWEPPRRPYESAGKGVIFVSRLREQFVRAIDVELEMALAFLREPDVVYDGDCLVYAPIITKALQVEGREAKNASAIGWASHAEKILVFRHEVTVDSGHVVDFTARQFQTQFEVPARWIAPERQYCERLAQATGVERVTIEVHK